MKVQLGLFGAFREYDPAAQITVEIPDGARVAELREAVARYGASHWPGFQPGLLARSAFASEVAVMRDGEPVPAAGRMAVLPPVSGG